MNGYYQIKEDDAEKINFRLGNKFSFPAHFHKKIELFLLVKGVYTITRNGKNIEMKSGDIILFDSYDIHSYENPTIEDIQGMVLIFPPNYVEKFINRKKGKKILTNLISDMELCQKIYDLGIKYVTPNNTSYEVKECTAELIMSLLENHLEYSQKIECDETSFVRNLLVHINENFKNELSLNILSNKFGYSPEHISRIFHRYLNVSLPDYVNKLRIEYINNSQKIKKQKINTLLYEAGFSSIQTYYRAKKKFNI